MQGIYPEIYIVSAYSKGQPNDNNDLVHRFYLTLAKANNLSVKEVEGRYEGKDEKSIVVVNTGQNARNFVSKVFAECKQESVLRLDATRQATLLYASGKEEVIGQFKAVSKDVAVASDAYTFDPVNKTYWVVV